MNIRDDFPILTRSSRGKPLVYLDNGSHQELNKSDFEKDEVIYLKNNIKYYASDAVIEYIYDLGGVFKTVKLLTLVPLTIRHFVYKVISKNRKRFFYK